MKIHFLLLALLAFVALSQHNVDARLHDPARRRMTEHRLLDELLLRRMEALEDDGEDYVEDGRDLLVRRRHLITDWEKQREKEKKGRKQYENWRRTGCLEEKWCGKKKPYWYKHPAPPSQGIDPNWSW